MSDVVMVARPIGTLVTITKDDPAGIQRTLDSARSMRLAGFEHIVIDGGSASTRTEFSSGQTEERGVKWCKLEPTGIADAFNEGLRLASGEWIWFLNGGDAVHESVDATWLVHLLSRTQSGIVTAAIQFDGEPFPRPLPALRYQWPLVACWFAHPGSLVRRDLIIAAGGFDARWKVAMDYDLWIRLLKSHPSIDTLSIPLARFDCRGVSERRENRSVARWEADRVVGSHAFHMLSEGSRVCLRSIKRLVVAFVFGWVIQVARKLK